FTRLALVGNDARIGRRVALAYLDATRGQFLAQRTWQRRAGDQRPPQRRGGRPRLRRGIEQNFQEVRRAEIAAWPEMRDRLELLLGMTSAGGGDPTTQRQRDPPHHVAAGGGWIRRRNITHI